MSIPIQFQQADDLWQAILTGQDSIQAKQQMLELCKLLFEYASLEDGEFNKIKETDQLTDFFIEYLDHADFIRHFMVTSKDALEPELKSCEFEKQIHTSQNDLDALVQKSEAMKQNYGKLIEQKKHLETAADEVENLEQTIARLKIIEEKVKPENMAQLQKENDLLQKEIGEKEPILDQIKKENETFQERHQHITHMIDVLTHEKNDDLIKLIELSDRLSRLLDESWGQKDAQLFQKVRILEQKNKMYKDVTQKLLDCLTDLQEISEAEFVNNELFQKHFSANSSINQAIRAENDHRSIIEAKKSKTKTLSLQISESLTTFDELLKEMVLAREEITEKVRQSTKMT